jgi:hypothetical protein
MTCLPPAEGIRHTLSPFHTTRKSAPLSGEARCLLSGPLQSGVRLLRDPLPAACSHALQHAYPAGPSGREDNGFTEFHGDDTVGWVLPLYRRCKVSVSHNWSRTSGRVPFWLRRVKLFSPVSRDGSYSSSPMFTLPPSLAPYPPVAGRVRNRSSRIESAAYAGGTLSERFRRFLTEAAIAHRLLMAEHQVGSALPTVKQADNHRRGFAPPGTPPSDSRRTHISTLPMWIFPKGSSRAMTREDAYGRGLDEEILALSVDRLLFVVSSDVV